MTRKAKPAADEVTEFSHMPVYPEAAYAALTAGAAGGEQSSSLQGAAGEAAPAAAPRAFDADGPMPATGGRFMRMPDGSLQRIEEDD
ncbi:MAG: hypothetical protein IT472_08835 [Thermomonas sp.]|uniref:hypothetical protein n=1 Tax=Thermomonas sp. TaxID=1971895 RepID=UPI00260B75D8|nr:hypothetical protein [Thermomonas sp.]MCC7097270.1 hypothetical protein [Thermomonas sp.]